MENKGKLILTNKQVQNFKYMSVSLSKKGINSEDIVSEIFQGTQIIELIMVVKYGFLRERNKENY